MTFFSADLCKNPLNLHVEGNIQMRVYTENWRIYNFSMQQKPYEAMPAVNSVEQSET